MASYTHNCPDNQNPIAYGLHSPGPTLVRITLVNFFRVLGGGSASFGLVQKDNSREIVNATYVTTNANNDTAVHDFINFSSDNSNAIQTCYEYNHNNRKDGILFGKQQGEIRPINQAIKIWKRTG